jgi:type III restriction enzyme
VDQDGLRVFDDSINKLYVMANESYEDFARALQTEYEEECGITFGKVPFTAFAKLADVVDGEEVPIGPKVAETIRAALIKQGMIDEDGRIQPAFDPRRPGFELQLPEDVADLAPAVVDLLSAYQIERHIRRAKDEGVNRLRKEVALSPEFQALWDRVKPKTTYRVEFETDALVVRAVDAIRRMEKIEAPKIRTAAGQVLVTKGGVTATAVAVAEDQPQQRVRQLPDILAYASKPLDARLLLRGGRAAGDCALLAGSGIRTPRRSERSRGLTRIAR